ncbi:MAG: response regulator [Burkholderiaceae bacterium]|jgi:CheY-like chemotaxis protein
MSAPTAPDLASDANRQRTVLVIDDEAPIRENLIRFLRLEGYRVIDAADGAAGLAAALQHTPDLILCDVMMPRMTGFEVLAALQATDTHRHVPLVFLSASAEPEKLEEGLSKGARNYVTKPFNLAILQRVIQQCLADSPPAPQTAPHGTGPST